jgi:hypothetical protein
MSPLSAQDQGAEKATAALPRLGRAEVLLEACILFFFRPSHFQKRFTFDRAEAA